jgi:hypothetical protein
VDGNSEVKFVYLIYGLFSDTYGISEFISFYQLFIIIYKNISLDHYKIIFAV